MGFLGFRWLTRCFGHIRTLAPELETTVTLLQPDSIHLGRVGCYSKPMEKARAGRTLDAVKRHKANILAVKVALDALK
jgi:hypothetical protein